jgi:hypothetical protein
MLLCRKQAIWRVLHINDQFKRVPYYTGYAMKRKSFSLWQCVTGMVSLVGCSCGSNLARCKYIN